MSQLPGELTTGVFNWLIQRPDGAGFGVTSCDRRPMLGATTLEPDVDLRPDKLVVSEDMVRSSLEVGGGLSSAAILQKDVAAGRWTGSSVRLLLGDWQDDEVSNPLCHGELGAVATDRGRLTMSVDLRPASARRPACIQTSPECRAILGDQQCRVDMRTRRRRIVVTAVESDGVEVNETDTEVFRMGRLRWLSGSRCGLENRIMAVDGAKIMLHGHDEMQISVGDRALLSEGCDGRRMTCSERFSNILNFRGEPDLPGSEILLRFPGG